MTADLIDGIVDEIAQDRVTADEWDWQTCDQRIEEIFQRKPSWSDEERAGFKEENLRQAIEQVAQAAKESQDELNGADNMRQVERIILLQMVDSHWKEHLLNMDHLKEGIGLRGYGQKNPLNEYKREAFDLFGTMIETVKQQTVTNLMRVRLMKQEEVERLEEERRQRQEQQMRLNRESGGDQQEAKAPIRRETEKVGRNAPCPCGSGKKYKKCCGRLQ